MSLLSSKVACAMAAEEDEADPAIVTTIAQGDNCSKTWDRLRRRRIDIGNEKWSQESNEWYKGELRFHFDDQEVFTGQPGSI